MRLSIQSLGRIQSAEIALAPLTVLLGPNNTNKTWVANAIYSAGRRLSLEGRLDGLTFPPPGELRAPAALSAAITEAKAALEARDGVEHAFELRAETLGALGPEGGHAAPAGTLSRWLGLPDSLPPRATVRWVNDDTQGLFDAAEGTLTRQGGKVALAARLLGPAFEAFPLDSTHPRSEVAGALLGLAGWLRDGIFRRAAVFPEERLSAVELPVRALAQERPWTSEAARDASRLLGELRGYNPETRSALGGDAEVHARLSEEVLQGRVEMDAGGDLSFRQGTLRLPLPAAGAGVRSLALLSLYLEYVASPGDLLVLDAPELGLGPRALEALAGLVGALPERGYLVIVATREPALASRLAGAADARIWSFVEQPDGAVAPTEIG